MDASSGAVYDDRPQRFKPHGKRKARAKELMRSGGPAEKFFYLTPKLAFFTLKASDLNILKNMPMLRAFTQKNQSQFAFQL